MITNTRNFVPTKKVFFNLPDSDSLSFRFNQRAEMQSRIYAQMLYRRSQGYNFYFGTLTYAPNFRPYFKLTRDFDLLGYDLSKLGNICYFHYNNKVEFSAPCFSREDIRLLVRGVQRDLLRMYGVTDYDYIVASEYGSHSEFCPHYHFIFAVPSKGVDKNGEPININAFKVHSLVKKHWSVIVPNQYDKNGAPVRVPRGFIFPRTVLGGRDHKGHFHKPFQIDTKNVSSIAKTAIYTSKYCCKQIGFWKNPNVSIIVDELKQHGSKYENEQFRKHKPFIKTSLHFGECLKEVVFNDCDWADGLIKVGSNPVENLYFGFHSTLKKKEKLCSFPQYIKRKLLYDYRLEEIEAVDVTETNTYISDDFNFSVPIPLSEMRTKKYYRYSYKLSEFGKDYKRFELKQSLQDSFIKFRDFGLTKLSSKEFEEFLTVNGWIDWLPFLKDFFSNDENLKDLCLYRKVYKDRVNPIMYYHYKRCPDDYKDVEMVETYKSKMSIKFAGGLEKAVYEFENIYFERYNAKDSLLSIDYRQYCDFDDQFNFGESCKYPYFDYYTSLPYMRKLADEFYCSDFDIINLPYNEEFAENFPICIFFNCFPCFSNFDTILLLTENYMTLEIEKKLKDIETKEKEKSNSKNQIYAV